MPTWIPWALMLVGAAVGVGLVIYHVVQSNADDGYEDEELDGSVTLAERRDPLGVTADEHVLPGASRRSRMLALKESLENSVLRGGGEDAGPADRMMMPWFLMVGAEGSGKTTVLQHNGLTLPAGPAFEVDPKRKDAGRWWLFDEAVVLEAPPAAPASADAAATLGRTMPSDPTEGWNTLLQMLRRERPDAPLNGIVVTVSCADLLEGRRKPQLLEAQADRVREFLDRARKTLGVRLPLHILVTKCDALPGFRSFATDLPHARRQDIFGWSNDARFDAPADAAGAIERGFKELHASLETLRDEVLAAPEEVRDSDGILVFVHEFPDVREPLIEFAKRLLPEASKRRPPLFLRGFYFCGEAIDPAAIPGIDDAGRLVFLRTLFRDKIFREAGMTRRLSRLPFARDVRVALSQAAVFLFALLGSAGLWATMKGIDVAGRTRPGLERDSESLARVLAGVVVDLEQVRRGAVSGDSLATRRVRDAAVVGLVNEMRGMSALPRSMFIPATWISPLPGDVRESMVVGVEQIVLPVIRQRLQERADRLLAAGAMPDPAATPEEQLAAVDPRSLTTYLSDVRTLSRNIARYNALAGSDSGGVRELSVLLEYLFGERLQADSLVSPEFERALVEAQAPRIVIAPARAADVLNRSVALVSTAAGAAARQLAPRPTAAAEQRVNPRADLQGLRAFGAIVSLLHPTRGLRATLSDSTILDLPLTTMIEDSIHVQLRLAAVRLSRDTLPPDQQGQRLGSVVQTLFDLRFMEREAVGARELTEELHAMERFRWDVGRLELALTLPNEFDQALVTVGQVFPGQSPERMRRALEVQFRERAVLLAALAQRFAPQTDESDPMADARASAANLETASSRLIRLAVLLDSLRASAESRRLLGAATRQAEQVVVSAQRMLDQTRPFTPNAAKIVAWQGVIPFGYAALDVTDSVRYENEIIRQLAAVRGLAHDVAPALRYLRIPGIAPMRVPRLVEDWEAIATAVAKYERGDPTSSLGALHRYLREGLAMRDINTCRAAATRDSVTAASDYFVVSRRQFRAAVASRCASASGEAVTRYERLRTLFNRQLAGRYPFADSAARPSREVADPAALRVFLRAYDDFRITGDVALRSDPRLSTTARAAIEFLDRVADARAFLIPALRDPRADPQYALLATPTDSAAIVDLYLGGRMLALDEGSREDRWRLGDSVRVDVEDDSGLRTVFAAGGPWALIRFLQAAPEQVSVRAFDPDAKLPLVLPTRFPAVAPEITLPRAR